MMTVSMSDDTKLICERYMNLKQALGSVDILPVTKTVSPERILALKSVSVGMIGENRVQEALSKLDALSSAFDIHIIGRLQTNKAKYVAKFASMVQSLDRLELASSLESALEKEGRTIDALIEVDIARDGTKAGIEIERAGEFLEALSAFKRIKIRGLMGVAPFSEDASLARPHFKALRSLYDELSKTSEGASFDTLSMGMSHDCFVAADEGATMVRIGSKIFGARV